MIVELGHFALALALVVALVQAAVPWMGAAKGREGWMLLGRVAAGSLFGLCSIAFMALLHAYALSDFSVLNVAKNSHTLTPLLYKLAGAWGNHEGSMLLWVWMLALWGFVASRLGRSWPLPFQARVLSCQGAIASGFLLFILYASNPFLRLDPPVEEGLGFNPVLQDPALALHPPLLYTGYVGFSLAFCFAIAALAEGKVDSAWARRLRPFALAAFAALSLGIALGSLWAYYELGWGGFWFWDPVENASLMPWLAGAALVHSLTVLEKRGTLQGWTVLLAVLAFSLSLLGTFLVRSGVLTSVHAFASDPLRGVIILALLSIAAGGGLLAWGLRAPQSAPGPGDFAPLSREWLMLLNNLFLFAFCATVFTGTLYPVFLSALDLGAVSVGAPYYTALLPFCLVPLVIFMGIAPHAPWQKADPALRRRLVVPLVLTVLVMLLPALSAARGGWGFLGLGLGAWIVCATLADAARKSRAARLPLSYWGMVAAHAGFALVIAGAAMATQWGSEKTLWMSPGDRAEIAGRTIAFLGAEEGPGPDYNATRAVFTVQKQKQPEDYDFLAPERRWYPVNEKTTSETALLPLGFGFLYLALGEADKDNPAKYVVRLYYHPFVMWVFGGGGLICLGALLAALDRRRHA